MCLPILISISVSMMMYTYLTVENYSIFSYVQFTMPFRSIFSIVYFTQLLSGIMWNIYFVPISMYFRSVCTYIFEKNKILELC